MTKRDTKYIQRKTKADLEWLWCEADSTIGISSNFSAVINAGIFGSGKFHDPFADDNVLSAISKKRPLEAAYFKCDQNTQHILYLNFSYTLTPEPYIQHTFRSLTPTVYAMPRYANTTFHDLCQRTALNKATQDDRLLIAAIRTSAERALDDACSRFQYELSLLLKK